MLYRKGLILHFELLYSNKNNFIGTLHIVLFLKIDLKLSFYYKKLIEHFWQVYSIRSSRTSAGFHLLVRLIGVNKGRHVTLKYSSILIKVSRKHRIFVQSFARWLRLFTCWCILHWLSTNTFLSKCNFYDNFSEFTIIDFALSSLTHG